MTSEMERSSAQWWCEAFIVETLLSCEQLRKAARESISRKYQAESIDGMTKYFDSREKGLSSFPHSHDSGAIQTR